MALGGECANSFSLASKETYQNKDCCYVFFFRCGQRLLFIKDGKSVKHKMHSKICVATSSNKGEMKINDL